MKNTQEPRGERRTPNGGQETKPEPPAAATPGPGPAGGSIVLRWFLSGTVRQAMQLRRHVGKILSAQRDLLGSPGIEAVRKSMDDLRATCVSGDATAIRTGVAELEKVANKWLRNHPNPGLRENVEVLLVAIAVAMAIRTFFLQPFKIPTGSMQPTLWGITSNPDFLHDGGVHEDLRPKPDFEMPGFLARLASYWINGVSYDHVVARTDGAVRAVQEQPTRFFIFDIKQSFWIGDDPQAYTIWFPPDNLFRRAGLVSGYGMLNPKVFKKGEEVIKMRSVSGDHLFVDRLSYNFRRPQRGEIVVFETRHIQHSQVPQDQFYIKRLVGMSDEKLRISKDRRLVVNGTELAASTPRFENLYSFDPKQEPPQNQYYGHEPFGLLAEGREYQVPPNFYVVCGDNTRNSLDSRFWGGFPREDVIGKAWFVYWPISTRFGWGYR
jgi:signal peptidase I